MSCIANDLTCTAKFDAGVSDGSTEDALEGAQPVILRTVCSFASRDEGGAVISQPSVELWERVTVGKSRALENHSACGSLPRFA